MVVVILATYRLTRIITTDTITERWRDRLYHWSWVEPDEPDAYARAAATQADGVVAAQGAGQPLPRAGGWRTYLNELFNCPWCMGWWIAYAVTAFWCWVVRDGVSVAVFLVLGAAVAGAQGFLASRQDA